MNVLLLGNGFDLNCLFPTKYINFLNTVNFLRNNSSESFMTVSDILGHTDLHQKDTFIEKCYTNHKDIYSLVPVRKEDIDSLVSMANSNMWYTFLSESYNEDIGWIDFESQIDSVINALQEIQREFYDNDYHTIDKPKKPRTAYLATQFGYFLHKPSGLGTVYSFKREYLNEDPKGSNNYVINCEKWTGKLKQQLDELAKMLQLYLNVFVEQPILSMDKSTMSDAWFVRLQPDFIVTFNYTSTLEHFLPDANVAHIHGRVDGHIVLGVNPNEDDNIETVDTTFIEFKKYHQRIVLGTDTSYRSFANQHLNRENDLTLTVMGHSLDITDKDIILELFEGASHIGIIYHSTQALKDYIAKLTILFGKEGIDEMRKKQNLQFIPLDENIHRYIDDVLRREHTPLVEVFSLR